MSISSGGPEQEYTVGATDPDLLKYVTVMLCIAVDAYHTRILLYYIIIY